MIYLIDMSGTMLVSMLEMVQQAVMPSFTQVIGRKLRHFHTPPLFSGRGPAGGDPVGISRRS